MTWDFSELEVDWAKVGTDPLAPGWYVCRGTGRRSPTDRRTIRISGDVWWSDAEPSASLSVLFELEVDLDSPLGEMWAQATSGGYGFFRAFLEGDQDARLVHAFAPANADDIAAAEIQEEQRGDPPDAHEAEEEAAWADYPDLSRSGAIRLAEQVCRWGRYLASSIARAPAEEDRRVARMLAEDALAVAEMADRWRRGCRVLVEEFRALTEARWSLSKISIGSQFSAPQKRSAQDIASKIERLQAAVERFVSEDFGPGALDT
jgi:hypothetical protein